MNLSEIASASALIKQELAPLAEKIGQGAEYSFGLFVKQVYVNAFTGLLWIIPGMILFLLSAKLYRTKTEYEADELMKWLGIIGSTVLGLILVLLSISGLIQAIINPEYQAIQLILQTLK